MKIIPDPAEKGTHRGRLWLYGSLAGGAALAAYSNCFNNALLFDDVSTIVRNVYIRSLANIPQMFRDANTFSAAAGNNAYRPLAAASFTLDYWLGGGLNPGIFHATQLCLHLLVALTVFLLFRRLLRNIGFGVSGDYLALFGAALFALHRLNSILVNYITLRSEILAALGALSSLLMFIALPRLRRTGLWLLPMLIGALAKPPALMFAPILAVYLVLFPDALVVAGEAPAPRPWRRWAWVSGVSCAVAAGMYLFLGRMGGNYLMYGGLSPRYYFQSQLFAWLHYFRLLFLPLGLSVDYEWDPVVRWYDTRAVAGAVFATLLVLGACVYARRRGRPGRLFLLGVLWYFLALAPSSSIIPLNDLTNEYRPYLAQIGLLLSLLAAAGDWLVNGGGRRWQKAALAAAGVALLAAHAAGTYDRNRDWRSEQTLWESVAVARPLNGRAWATLGRLYIANHDVDRARVCAKQAERYFPGYYVNTITLAMLDMYDGRMAEAGERLKKMVGEFPNSADAHAAYAEWLRMNRRAPEAVAEYRIALEQTPAHLPIRRSLLSTYAELQDWPSFCPLARDTLQSDPLPEFNTMIVQHCTGNGGNAGSEGNAPSADGPVIGHGGR